LSLAALALPSTAPRSSSLRDSTESRAPESCDPAPSSDLAMKWFRLHDPTDRKHLSLATPAPSFRFHRKLFTSCGSIEPWEHLSLSALALPSTGHKVSSASTDRIESVWNLAIPALIRPRPEVFEASRRDRIESTESCDPLPSFRPSRRVFAPCGLIEL
jgi:hypothetical protein